MKRDWDSVRRGYVKLLEEQLLILPGGEPWLLKAMSKFRGNVPWGGYRAHWGCPAGSRSFAISADGEIYIMGA